MRTQRPDAVLAYTIKPVIWGGLAARLAGVPKRYSLITGLGYAFVGGGGREAGKRQEGRGKREEVRGKGQERGQGGYCRLQTWGGGEDGKRKAGDGIQEAAGPEVCALPAVDGKNISCDSRAINTQPFNLKFLGYPKAEISTKPL